MNLAEVLTALRHVVEQARSAQADASAALDRWDERGATLEWWLTGTNDPDALAVLENHAATSEDLRVAWQTVGRSVELIESYIAALEGVAPSGAAPGGRSAGGGPASEPSAPPPVVNDHGDAYPPEAAGLVEQLPKRVTPNAGDRTVGVIRLGDRVLPPMSSGLSQNGQEDMWSAKVRERLDGMGIKAEYLAAHVEMKLAALMRDTQQSSAEVAINYTPCGYERNRALPASCHRVLENFLPDGYSLTVYGTSQDNQPFRHTYRGRGRA